MKSYLKPFFLLLFLGALSFSFTNKETPNPNIEEPVVVVQLFTSQGCSSCPSADELLSEIKKDYNDKNVFVLSYHIDYWDRLGWKDPFSNKKYTALQNKYASKFEAGKVYTPQAVINGKQHFVGSNKGVMNSGIATSLDKESENAVSFSNVENKEGEVRVHYKVNGITDARQLMIAMVIDQRSTKIQKGENIGKTLSSSNIVIEEFALPLLKTEGILVVKIPELANANDKLSIVGFVQKTNLDITGASSIKVQ